MMPPQFENVVREVSLKSLKSKALTPYHSQPVWCSHCCVRIAPYDLKTTHHGKAYHRDCYIKLVHAQSKK
jgi:hypothetical protein